MTPVQVNTELGTIALTISGEHIELPYLDSPHPRWSSSKLIRHDVHSGRVPRRPSTTARVPSQQKTRPRHNSQPRNSPAALTLRSSFSTRGTNTTTAEQAKPSASIPPQLLQKRKHDGSLESACIQQPLPDRAPDHQVLSPSPRYATVESDVEQNCEPPLSLTLEARKCSGLVWPRISSYGAIPAAPRDSPASTISSQNSTDSGYESGGSQSSHYKLGAQQNPRRSGYRPQVPSLPSQSIPSECFVSFLMYFATAVIASIWPTSAYEANLDLFTFVSESLRRSKTSYSTLQVALFYLISLKDHLPGQCLFQEQTQGTSRVDLQCGRRMFLTAIMLAQKYLQDKNYSTKAWCKITGLECADLNKQERLVLQALDYRLHIPKETFNAWNEMVISLCKTTKYLPPPERVAFDSRGSPLDWSKFVDQLNPDIFRNPANVQMVMRWLQEYKLSVPIYTSPYKPSTLLPPQMYSMPPRAVLRHPGVPKIEAHQISQENQYRVPIRPSRTSYSIHPAHPGFASTDPSRPETSVPSREYSFLNPKPRYPRGAPANGSMDEDATRKLDMTVPKVSNQGQSISSDSSQAPIFFDSSSEDTSTTSASEPSSPATPQDIPSGALGAELKLNCSSFLPSPPYSEIAAAKFLKQGGVTLERSGGGDEVASVIEDLHCNYVDDSSCQGEVQQKLRTRSDSILVLDDLCEVQRPAKFREQQGLARQVSKPGKKRKMVYSHQHERSIKAVRH